MGVKATLPPFCAVVTISVNLNFLKHPGPLQACNGTDLLLTILQSSFFFSEMTVYKNVRHHIRGVCIQITHYCIL